MSLTIDLIIAMTLFLIFFGVVVKYVFVMTVQARPIEDLQYIGKQIIQDLRQDLTSDRIYLSVILKSISAYEGPLVIQDYNLAYGQSEYDDVFNETLIDMDFEAGKYNIILSDVSHMPPSSDISFDGTYFSNTKIAFRFQGMNLHNISYQGIPLIENLTYTTDLPTKKSFRNTRVKFASTNHQVSAYSKRGKIRLVYTYKNPDPDPAYTNFTFSLNISKSLEYLYTPSISTTINKTITGSTSFLDVYNTSGFSLTGSESFDFKIENTSENIHLQVTKEKSILGFETYIFILDLYLHEGDYLNALKQSQLPSLYVGMAHTIPRFDLDKIGNLTCTSKEPYDYKLIFVHGDDTHTCQTGDMIMGDVYAIEEDIMYLDGQKGKVRVLIWE